jgi:hypothetical protein
VTTEYDKVIAWNERWNKERSRFNVPVAYCLNPDDDPDEQERNVTTTYGMAFLSSPKDGSQPQAVVRLFDFGTQFGSAPLDRLEVLEDVITAMSQMGKPDGGEAIQHNPECPDCYVEMNWDEGFDCPVCLTHFDDNGMFSYKPCVEYDCSEQGDLVGADGQPRCTNCTVLVLAGELEPFKPYDCKRCKTNVVGIPARSKAAEARLCGSDQAAVDRQEFLDGILSRRH